MSSGARHGIGVLIGLVVTPVIALCLFYAVNRAALTFRRFFLDGEWSDRLIVLALVLVAAVLLGLVMGSRLSPVASLVPGAVFTVAGLMWLLAPRFTADHTLDVLPRSLDRGYSTVGPIGLLLLLGVALLTASLPPSRWRVAGASPARSRYGAPPGPMGPGGAAPPPPQYAAPLAPGAQFQPGPSPYAHGSAQPPPYAPPAASSSPAPAQPPPAPEPPPEAPRPGGGAQRQEAGEWTQMYGGDDLRGGSGGQGGGQ